MKILPLQQVQATLYILVLSDLRVSDEDGASLGGDVNCPIDVKEAHAMAGAAMSSMAPASSEPQVSLHVSRAAVLLSGSDLFASLSAESWLDGEDHDRCGTESSDSEPPRRDVEVEVLGSRGHHVQGAFWVRHYTFKASLRADMEHAALIVSHASTGSVLEAADLRKPPLMDNYQLELALSRVPQPPPAIAGHNFSLFLDDCIWKLSIHKGVPISIVITIIDHH
eukprot:m51a1_g4889 hypothetical protein (224) ;mRNA; f:77035-82881